MSNRIDRSLGIKPYSSRGEVFRKEKKSFWDSCKEHKINILLLCGALIALQLIELV